MLPMAEHNDHGKVGEVAVERYLASEGYKIIDRNWKHKQAEIDIIAQKHGVIYFVEVKYRQSAAQGSGFDYITPKKLKQMAFAAELWVAVHKWDGEYTLSAAQVSGQDLPVDFVEDCTF